MDAEDADPIREVLIHAHYLSQKDIEICAAFDIAPDIADDLEAAHELFSKIAAKLPKSGA